MQLACIVDEAEQGARAEDSVGGPVLHLRDVPHGAMPLASPRRSLDEASSQGAPLSPSAGAPSDFDDDASAVSGASDLSKPLPTGSSSVNRKTLPVKGTLMCWIRSAF